MVIRIERGIQNLLALQTPVARLESAGVTVSVGIAPSLSATRWERTLSGEIRETSWSMDRRTRLTGAGGADGGAAEGGFLDNMTIGKRRIDASGFGEGATGLLQTALTLPFVLLVIQLVLTRLAGA